ncbi:hypothetical protein SLS57_012063 [Botryosphaeria dothidea]
MPLLQGDRMRIMLFDGQGLLEPANFNQSNYAVKVLTQRDNMARKLFQDKDNMRTEWTADISDGGRVKAVPKIDAVYTHFQDRVERECHILEQMFAYQARTSAPGKALRFTPRQYLEGYDFMDVATAQDPLYPKALKIDYKGRGWVDFTRAINAVTLFGRGFGELAKPSSSSNALCRTLWKDEEIRTRIGYAWLRISSGTNWINFTKHALAMPQKTLANACRFSFLEI